MVGERGMELLEMVFAIIFIIIRNVWADNFAVDRIHRNPGDDHSVFRRQQCFEAECLDFLLFSRSHYPRGWYSSCNLQIFFS